jgi:hypothetical protein
LVYIEGRSVNYLLRIAGIRVVNTA